MVDRPCLNGAPDVARDVLEIVDRDARIYPQRGHHLMEHARNQRTIAILARQRLSAVPLRVLKQIDSHNELFVVRRVDRIVVSRAA